MDKVLWKESVGASFTVSEAFNSLASGSTILFPTKGIWVGPVPLLRQRFFNWEAAWGKVLTLDKLQRRGWHLPNICYLCGYAEETIHHLLLHCPIVNSLWEIIFSLFGLSWVFPKTIKEAILSRKGYFVGKKNSKVWKSVPVCIFWTVWKKRNYLAFRNGCL